MRKNMRSNQTKQPAKDQRTSRLHDPAQGRDHDLRTPSLWSALPPNQPRGAEVKQTRGMMR